MSYEQSLYTYLMSDDAPYTIDEQKGCNIAYAGAAVKNIYGPQDAISALCRKCNYLQKTVLGHDENFEKAAQDFVTSMSSSCSYPEPRVSFLRSLDLC